MSELSQIHSLIEAGESEVLEWKRSTAQLPRAAETLCAFLNGDGGTVLLGVNDDGEIIGQEVSDKTRLDIAAVIRAIEPAPIISSSEILVSGNRYMILLKASSCPNFKPYLYRGRAYQWLGPSTSVMGQEELARLVRERPENETLWERRRVQGLRIEDLEAKEIVRVAKLGIETGRVPSDISFEPEELLRGFKLLSEYGEVTNAAAVLFAGSGFLSQRLVQSSLRLARFKGNNKSEFLDQNLVHGGAFHLLSEAEMFIRRHQPVAAMVVPDQLQIKQSPLIPNDALRETLTNALIHRDYSNPGGEASVAIFDDRMEIRNAGRLPSGIQLEALKSEHGSVLRNPLIAGVFYSAGLIESWGRGTLKTIELCKGAGLEEPVYEEGTSHVRVIFSAPFTSAAAYERSQSDKLQLDELQAQILGLLFAGKKTPMRELVDQLDSNERAIQRSLKGLIDLGFVRRHGRGRATGYLKALCVNISETPSPNQLM